MGIESLLLRTKLSPNTPQKMYALKRRGYSLQWIGDRFGVTRERVRQILAKHYGEIHIELLPENKVARVIGCTVSRLKALKQKGILTPKHYGHAWLYKRDEMEKAILALQRNCQHCGQPILVGDGGWKYCPECREEHKRYSYPFRTGEGKKKCEEASRSWKRRNPEKARISQKRAEQKRQEKRRREHYSIQRYIVVSKSEIMPIGSVFKAIGSKNSHLILANGTAIPVRCVRKLDGG